MKQCVEELGAALAKITALESSSQLLIVERDAAREDRDRWRGELNRLEREAVTLRQQNKDAWTNRDHFCEYINKIGYLFWADDKQCYAPDAVFRMVEGLQAKVEQFTRHNEALKDQLTAIYQQVTNGPLCYFGDHTGYECQFSSEQTVRWYAALQLQPTQAELEARGLA